ncbi:RNA methyltransferase [Winogradskyella schleiferi]|uniref:RNA methyltransferase n=1 Tax=Winogradskyella schleiferi TaxID=2686078 RepID=UPI0015BEB211|nr:RNA methyltransferase [Winogradskyella schleiferi]
MAYAEFLADCIRQQLKEKRTHFDEMKMMGGLHLKVDHKMLCGIHIDNNYGDSLIMARIGQAIYETELKKPECLPMDFTDRAIKGYIFVTPEGFDTDNDLPYWLDLCLEFNPLVKARKFKKKTK